MSSLKRYRTGLVNPASNAPPVRNTRYASRHTGSRSGTKQLETGCTIRSKDSSAKTPRSAMSPSMVSIARPSREATSRSCSSCRGELSKTTTSAPAAARIGPCWPPPEARQRTLAPARSGYHSGGTARVGVSTICHWPPRAAAISSDPTGTVHRLPLSTSASQARRLSSRMLSFTRTPQSMFRKPRAYRTALPAMWTRSSTRRQASSPPRSETCRAARSVVPRIAAQ